VRFDGEEAEVEVVGDTTTYKVICNGIEHPGPSGVYLRPPSVAGTGAMVKCLPPGSHATGSPLKHEF
jgi:hypothetical protein